jgi:hypothetical protein
MGDRLRQERAALRGINPPGHGEAYAAEHGLRMGEAREGT